MRLTRLSLRHYGSFADASLRFDPAPERINLVLAPNGAGKSVLRGAFGDLFFGIGAQTPMGFRHGYAGMQIAAEGLAADGTPFCLTRRKGRGNTLLGADEAPVEPGLLARLLGDTDRAQMERLFALDTERLRAGGQGLLASGGALAEALLEAAGGLRQARVLRQELETLRDQLAPPRKSAQRPFYAALDRWTESRRALRAHLVRPEHWLEQERSLAAARQRREAASQAATAAGQALHRLERVRRLRPILARHDLAAGWLATHPDAPGLPPGLQDRLPAARQAARQAVEAREALRQRLAELSAQQTAIRPDPAVLERESRITALLEAAGAAGKARLDLPQIQAEARACQLRMESVLRALGLGWPASRAAEALPSATALARARRLVHDHARHREALETAPPLIARQETALAATEAALQSLPPPRDVEALGALIAAITAEGDPVKVAASAARATAQAHARLEAALARLPLPWRDLTTLRDLAPPEPAVLHRLATAREAARLARQEQVTAFQRLAAALAATRQERAALGREGPLPNAAMLAAARARREAGWALVYRRLLGETPDPQAEQAYGDGQPLPLAYTAAVAEADRLADLRNAEAERISAAERLDRSILEQEALLATARTEAALAEQHAAQAEAAWAGLLHPLGLDAETGPAELERLLAQRCEALEAAAALTAAHAAEQEIATRQAADARRLLRALGEAEPPVPSELRALLDRAEAEQRAARQTEGERTRLLLLREAARKDLAEARRSLAAAEARMTGWRSEWQSLLAELGRAPDEGPEEIEAVLRLLEELGPLVREAASLETRIGGMQAEIRAFEANCRALSEELGRPPPADATAAARALAQQLQAEQGAAERQALLARQAAEAAETLAAAEQAAAQAEASLQAAVAATGAETVEAAEARLSLAAERDRQQALQEEARRELLEAADGQSLETVRQEVEAIAADQVEAELAAARDKQIGQQAEAQEAAAAAAQAEAALKALGNETAFAEAVQDQQAAIARMGQALEDALLLHAAGALLEAALERVQEAGDDRLLRRIGEAFARLTEGAYPAIAAREDDKGVAHLVIRRRDFPAEDVAVDELSEGTRDQLFLALRLIAIEDHAARALPLPFLGDDILQSFDDGRAAAAFRTLLEFSRTTQVILLTHHRHLLDVAAAALAPDQLHLQQLEG